MSLVDGEPESAISGHLGAEPSANQGVGVSNGAAHMTRDWPWFWSWWVFGGAVTGGVTAAVLGAVLFVVHAKLTFSWSPDDAGFVPWAGAAVGVWGTVGGFVVGVFCALATSFAERRGLATKARYGIVAASITAGFASLICLMSIGFDGLDDSVHPVVEWAVWLVIPVIATSLVASLFGLRLWSASHRAAPGPSHD